MLTTYVTDVMKVTVVIKYSFVLTVVKRQEELKGCVK